MLHQLLAHLNQNYIKFMVKNEILSHDSAVLDPSGNIECESCRLCKSQAREKGVRLRPRQPHHENSNRDVPSDLENIVMGDTASTRPLDLVHCDGFQFDFPSGEKLHFFLFVDDYSDYKMVYPVSSKADFITCLQAYQAFAFYYLKKNIKVLKLDNASEMSSEDVYSFARFNGIHLIRCTPYEHHQNGNAERGVRTIQEAALTLLHHAKLSVQKFLKYAVVNATQVRNKCISKKTMKFCMSPYEIFTGAKPKLLDIHAIGQVCYSYIKKEQRRVKYDPKARTCLYLCEDFERRAYLLYDVSNRSIIQSRDVRFPRFDAHDIFASRGPLFTTEDEAHMREEKKIQPDYESDASLKNLASPNGSLNSVPGGKSSSSFENSSEVTSSEITIPDLLSKLSSVEPSQPSTPIVGPPTPPLTSTPNDAAIDSTPNCNPRSSDNRNLLNNEVPVTLGPALSAVPIPADMASSSRESSVRRKNSRYFNSDFINSVTLDTLDSITPKSYNQACKSTHAEKWDEAMKKELNSLHKQATWDLVPRVPGMYIVRCKWVYKIKTDEFGKISRYKARLVARGFTQTPGVDFDETYSPVVDVGTRRLFLAIASDPQMVTKQMDIETAFLQSELDKEIYLEPPPGLEIPKNMILKLRKAIYGLKQSPLLWYLTAYEFFSSLGFCRCVSDPCLLQFENPSGKVYLCIYVDDIILCSRSRQLVDWVVNGTKKRFPVRDEKPLSWIVGLHIEENNGLLHVSQQTYIQSLISRFLKSKRSKRSTPMPTDSKCLVLPDQEFSGENDLLDHSHLKMYQQIVGGLNYLCHASRPDIAFPVNVLSRYLSTPRQLHLESAFRVLEYLNSTLSLRIRFAPSCAFLLEAYSDANFPSKNSLDGKATCGYCIFFNSNLVLWKSVKLNVVCLSTMEAELCAISLAIVQLQFFQNLLREIGFIVEKLIVYTDSETAMKYLQTSPLEAKPRSRHLAVRYHFIRDLWFTNQLELKYVPSEEQVADIFTKPLPKSSFEYLREKLVR